jgi:hypothetical protein
MARYKHIDMLARHRENDALPVEPGLAEKDVRQIERLEREGGRKTLSRHETRRVT